MKQPNDIGNNKDLALYRMDIAKDDLRSAKILLDADEYRGANKDEAKDLIDTAEKLIELIEKYIDKIEK